MTTEGWPFHEDLSEKHGVWWLPKYPEHRLPGILRIQKDHSCRLQVFGAFPEVPAPYFETIHGQDQGGRAASLYGAEIISSTMLSPGPQGRMTFAAPVCLLGSAFKSYKEIRFVGLAAALPGLVEWLRPGDWLSHEESAEGGYRVFPRKGGLQTDCRAELDGTVVSLRSSGVQWAGSTDHEIRFLQDAVAEIEVSADQDIPFLVGILTQVRNLIALFDQRRPVIEGLWGKTSPDGGRFQFGALPELQTRIFHRDVTGEVERINRLWSPVVEAEQVAPQFRKVFGEWAEHSRQLPAVHSIFFATRGRFDLPADVRFLNLTQCVEAYARTNLSAHYVPREEWLSGEAYRSLAAAIPSTLKDSFRASLKKRLEWAHAHSLRKMVASVVDSLPAIREHLIRCPSVFAEDVAEWRNGLTHVSDELQAAVKGRPAIEILTQYLEITLTCRFLADLGVEDKGIGSLLTSGNHFPTNGLSEYWGTKKSQYRRPESA